MALNYNFYFWMETLRERDTMCAQSAQTSRGISVEGKVEVKYLRWKQHLFVKKVFFHQQK